MWKHLEKSVSVIGRLYMFKLLHEWSEWELGRLKFIYFNESDELKVALFV